jgi:RNA polymerase sigma-70 factor (ECF subfamily)
MDTAETAESLGIQEQAVKTRLHRPRKVLKGLLEFHVGSDADNVFNFLGARCDRIVAVVLARIAVTNNNPVNVFRPVACMKPFRSC